MWQLFSGGSLPAGRRPDRCRIATSHRQPVWAVCRDDDDASGNRRRGLRRWAGMARVRISLQAWCDITSAAMEHSAPASARLADVVCRARRRSARAVVRQLPAPASGEQRAGSFVAGRQPVPGSSTEIRARNALRIPICRCEDACGDRAMVGSAAGGELFSRRSACLISAAPGSCNSSRRTMLGFGFDVFGRATRHHGRDPLIGALLLIAPVCAASIRRASGWCRQRRHTDRRWPVEDRLLSPQRTIERLATSASRYHQRSLARRLLQCEWFANRLTGTVDSAGQRRASARSSNAGRRHGLHGAFADALGVHRRSGKLQ